MTSSAREILKWLALVLMTGDHAVKVLAGGYVPVVSELGRVAFPLFALVMAYNLAQPEADYAKSFRRLSVWGLVAQPIYGWTFDVVLPVNILLSFALAVACCWAAQNRRWGVLLVLAGPLPLLVDYQWSGVALVLAGWLYFKRRRNRACWLIGSYEFRPEGCWAFAPVWIWAAMGWLCYYNGNGWALWALPVIFLVDVVTGEFGFWNRIRRTRWGFYGYYVGHLAVLALIALVSA